jgi:hypothetical protein
MYISILPGFVKKVTPCRADARERPVFYRQADIVFPHGLRSLNHTWFYNKSNIIITKYPLLKKALFMYK